MRSASAWRAPESEGADSPGPKEVEMNWKKPGILTETVSPRPDGEICGEAPLRFADDTFRLLRDYIHDYAGIYFDDASRPLLEKRLSRRLRLLHIASFRDYYRFLKYDRRRDDELAQLMDLLTVNETYFFREPRQLKAFTAEILPEIRGRRRDRRLRIWSAGCASGEEPYTLAMLILEDGGFGGWDVEIFGSDINQYVLQKARRGLYRESAFRATERYYQEKYFRAESDGLYAISDAVRRMVTFGHLNLLDEKRVCLLGGMDVIFCRNVMIYFDQSARRKVSEVFHRALVEGGYLLLGHAESLMNVSTAFELCHLTHDMVYRRPAPGGRADG